MIVRFVDIGASDDHHCLNFLFIIQIGVIRDRIYFTGTPYFTLCVGSSSCFLCLRFCSVTLLPFVLRVFIFIIVFIY